MISKIFEGVILVMISVLIANAQTDVVLATTQNGQQNEKQKIVVVTGARFSYKLVQHWIDEFNKHYPDIQVIIESRGSSDPAQYDILAEVYEHDNDVKKDRHYLYVARYAILPVATGSSQFAKAYATKGLNDNLIKQIFFHNIFADKEEEQKIRVPFTVYTRFQKAGAPKVFAKYYGFDQKDINGKAIAGSDEHLLKALLRDSTGLTYLPLPVAFDPQSKGIFPGLTIIPVDLDGNGKVKDDEAAAFVKPENLIRKLEGLNKDATNVPIEHLHLSISRSNASLESIAFLKWVAEHGSSYLGDFGFLHPEPNKLESQQFLKYALKQTAP